MLRIIILSIALAAAVNALHRSVASASQMRFALENNYDDTGPGAKTPEYAFHTYKTLQEALVSYVGDKDTKLPEHERARVANYVNTDFSQPIRELPKTVEEYTGLKLQEQIFKQPILSQPSYQPIQPLRYRPEKLSYQDPSTRLSYLDFRSSNLNRNLGNERNPLSLAQVPYTQDLDFNNQPYNAHPQYTFSYGVHDKKTGDLKSAQESRNGGSVKGYYTFVDPDGKQRTVHYTADDKYGFRANVQRTQ